jgi:hypothetical protein
VQRLDPAVPRRRAGQCAAGRRRLGVRTRQRAFPRAPRMFPRPPASQSASKSSRPRRTLWRVHVGPKPSSCPMPYGAARPSSPARAALLPFPCACVAYKGRCSPPRRANQPRRPTEPPPVPRPSRRGELQSRPSASQGGPSSTSPAPTIARRPVHNPSRAPTSPVGQPRRLPPLAVGAPPTGSLSPLTEFPNRTLVTPSPSSRPSPAKLQRASPEFSQPAPAGRPRGHIAKQKFFPRASVQSGNSNSKTIWLILVNCVENRRKNRKIQN